MLENSFSCQYSTTFIVVDDVHLEIIHYLSCCKTQSNSMLHNN